MSNTELNQSLFYQAASWVEDAAVSEARRTSPILTVFVLTGAAGGIALSEDASPLERIAVIAALTALGALVGLAAEQTLED